MARARLRRSGSHVRSRNRTLTREL
jgi:hypothetical protein